MKNHRILVFLIGVFAPVFAFGQEQRPNAKAKLQVYDLKRVDEKDSAFNQNTPTSSSTSSGANHIDKQNAKSIDVLSAMSFTPSHFQGEIQGYKVANLIPNTLYANQGLRIGDVILKVNSESCESALKLIGLLSSIEPKKKTVEILRENKPMTLTIRVP